MSCPPTLMVALPSTADRPVRFVRRITMSMYATSTAKEFSAMKFSHLSLSLKMTHYLSAECLFKKVWSIYSVSCTRWLGRSLYSWCAAPGLEWWLQARNIIPAATLSS